jgi:DNA invertase Pin-like site-specific DNA recombinase
MLVGYARSSTVDQVAGLEAQERDLRDEGAEELFSEQISSVAQRAMLEQALQFIRKGDTLLVTKLDRLARSVRDLLEIFERVNSKGARLKILSMNLDTETATGRLMLQVLGAVAEFERGLMLERQREGIAKAKAAGKYRGRKPTARARKVEIEQLLRSGVGAAEAGRRLGISRSSVYRIADRLTPGG